MPSVLGVDGTRDGWVGACWEGPGFQPVIKFFSKFCDVFEIFPQPAITAVDMPIGLLSQAIKGGRDCESIGRKILKRRHSSVFSSPVRSALEAENYGEALQLNRISSNKQREC
ncbi:MAG: DUF429 domain-containing protein [Magnetococcales bacterium]|nr:DUF429 domain-containing protein [Magnetococcales bacterium]